MKTTYIVSASHVHPDYRLDQAEVTVGHDENDTYSAQLSGFGYVCGFPSPAAAINDLLRANACSNIVITDEDDNLIY